MSNDRQVTLTKCDYCGKYYEACNIHKCKKQPQQEKYIPCTHCTVQRCKDCDYRMHQKVVDTIQTHKSGLILLRNHIKCYVDDEIFKQDFETVTDVLTALELVE